MKKFTAMSVIALAVLGTAAAIAQAPAPAPAAATPPAPPPPPTPRQAVMQSNRTTSAAYSEMAIGVVNPTLLRQQAQTLIDNGAKIAALFAASTSGEADPRAKPEIWTDAAGFKAANDKYIAAARVVLTAVPDRIKMTEAMRDLQETCTGCHTAYRIMAAAPADGRGRGGRGRGAAAPAAEAGAAAPAAGAAAPAAGAAAPAAAAN